MASQESASRRTHTTGSGDRSVGTKPVSELPECGLSSSSESPPASSRSESAPSEGKERESSLSEEEREVYETIKERLRASRIELAEGLYRVRSDRLYREEYGSFRAFCQAEVGYTGRYGRRLAQWGRLRSILNPPPKREAHADALPSGRPNEELREIWDEVQRQADEKPSGVSAALIERVVSDCENASKDNSPEEGSGGGDEKENRVEESSNGEGEALTRRGENRSGNGEGSEDEEGCSVGPEGSVDTGSEGDDEAPDGFSIYLPPSADLTNKRAGQNADLTPDVPSRADVEDLARKVDQKTSGLPHSSGEAAIAPKVWRVLISSLTEYQGSLPEEPTERALLRPERLGQVTDVPSNAEKKRVLVCPGIDLFSNVVPSGVIEAILHRCRQTEHLPVLFTKHLGRAASFDLRGTWIGSPADRSSLSSIRDDLKEAAPRANVRWILYDIGEEDQRKRPPFSSEGVNWVVFDPPGGAGVSLTIKEIRTLIEAAEEAGLDWAFRSSFKTGGATYPSTS